MNLSDIPEKVDSATSGLNFLKVWKYPKAFSEAISKAKDSKDKWPHQRISVFWSSFKDAINGVNKEAAQVTGDTELAVQENYQAVLSEVKSEIAVDDRLDSEDQEFFDEILATSVKSFEENPVEDKSIALSGVKKIKDAEKKDSEAELSDEEKLAVASLSIVTLRNLKKQYPKEADFLKAMNRLQKVSSKSKFPAMGILQSSLLGVFKIKTVEEGHKFVKLLGISDASASGELLAGIVKEPIENREGIIKFFKEHLLKFTRENEIGLFVDQIHKLIKGGSRSMNVEQFTKLVFYIDPKDYDHMAEIFSGRRGTKI